ncbi:DUF6768 family protein [Permianibacter aggregans]|uniref:Uncharacterized protein n=1 Tax=Permianibacter aggregans TaxID=1510150 RepID=A0A4R6UNK4_9GAMM|nr:DUF6768 family protein [Permianibacter aggregans]QGX38382.1 hypothetical protein E2H98_01355 [Permianibacter aggregans]TDQ48710.1 hypothetical protein EV696_106150 [Permianibacter aggregans]
MNIDQRIKAELEQESAEIDRILGEDKGITSMMANSMKGNLGRWFLIANLFVLIFTGAMITVGYQFFTADETGEQVFWGILLVLSLQMQIGLKQWLWQEMSRSSLLREIKRMELALARMSEGKST